MVRATTLLLVLCSVIATTQALPKLEYETSSSYSNSDVSSDYSGKDSSKSREVINTKGESGSDGSTSISKVRKYDDEGPSCVVKIQQSEGSDHVEKCKSEQDYKEPPKDY